MKSSIFK